MKRLIFPKSVRDSQNYISWAFPVLLGFGATGFPQADLQGLIALTTGMLVVATGWLSFGLIEENQYNDALFIVDLALLTVYGIVLYYGRLISSNSYAADSSVFSYSGTIFLLYSIWDIVALCGRDTAAIATGAHLRRFAKICFVFAIFFFLLSYLSLVPPYRISVLGINQGTIRIAGFIVWAGILCWWHIGRFRAAVQDSGPSRQKLP